MDSQPLEETYCATFHRAVELIGRRWNGVIVHALLSGAERFGEIRSSAPGISDRLLTERLRQLECAGVLVRACPEVGVPRYILTDKGHDLIQVLDAISSWAARWDFTDQGQTRATDAVAKARRELSKRHGQ